MISYQSEYAMMIKSALLRNSVWKYILNRLPESLNNIGIDSECSSNIINLLLNIINSENFDSDNLSEIVSEFRNKWGTHLNRAYLIEYEDIRWQFVDEKVFKNISQKKETFGRCLDIGCGRGCLTKSIISSGYAKYATGIDAVDFSAEWRERQSKIQHLTFKKVPVLNIESELNVLEPFDTIFLFYVLHHSNDYWNYQTLRSIYKHLNKDGLVIIVEDSLFLDAPKNTPTNLEHDPNNLSSMWRNWGNKSSTYHLSEGYDIQILLDFVAVQLLAGFLDVSMPCNYKTSEEWQNVFEVIGFKIQNKFDLGFSEKRDIDVPQSLFVLRLN